MLYRKPSLKDKLLAQAKLREEELEKKETLENLEEKNKGRGKKTKKENE